MLVQSILTDRDGSPRPAVVSAHREASVSYAELAGLAKAASAELAAAGVRRGDRVAILLPNSVEFAVAAFAALLSGAAAVPLDLYQKREDLGKILALLQPAALVSNRWLFRKIRDEAAGTAACLIDCSAGLQVERLERGDRGAVPDVEGAPPASPEDDAFLILSSGSTGLPKAVRLSHRAVLSNVRMHLQSLGLPERPRGLQVLPMSYSYGLVASFLATLQAGGTAVLLSDAEPGPLWDAAKRYDTSLFMGAPALFQYVLENSGADRVPPCLRYVTVGGDRCPRHVLELIQHRLPSARIFITYGLSEAGPRVSTLPPDLVADRPDSVGLPLEGVTVSIRRPDGGTCPAGVPGEIVVRSPSLMSGYYGDPERTRRVLQNGWCRTGDTGYRDAGGYLYCTGRLDRQFKIGGRIVHPARIEASIAAHPAVQEVHVHKEETLGREVICASIRAADQAPPDLLEQLRALCRQRLPAFMVPSRLALAGRDVYYHKGRRFDPRREPLPASMPASTSMPASKGDTQR